MSDGVFVVNEILDLAKRTNRECLVFKIDFERAYGCVSWSLLRFVLRRLNLCDKWLKWMKDLVFKGSISILVNGSASKDF